MLNSLAKFWDGDLAWSWRHHPVAIVATLALASMLAGRLAAGRQSVRCTEQWPRHGRRASWR